LGVTCLKAGRALLYIFPSAVADGKDAAAIPHALGGILPAIHAVKAVKTMPIHTNSGHFLVIFTVKAAQTALVITGDYLI